MKPITATRLRPLLALALTAIASDLVGQVIPLTVSGMARENFNGIGTGTGAILPPGWTTNTVLGNAYPGMLYSQTSNNVTHAASSGTPTASGSYNWGAGSTDRAVGFMSEANTSPNAVVAVFQNQSGSAFTSFDLSYRLERYHINGGQFRGQLFYATTNSLWHAMPSGYTSNAVFATGPSAYTFTTPRTIYKNVTIPVSVPAGDNLYIMWMFETTDGSADGQGIGLDDVVMRAGSGAAAVSASLKDVLQNDVNSNGVANPGDGIRYGATVRNRGNAPATGTTYSSPAVANTTPTGTVRTSALARDDAYTLGSPGGIIGIGSANGLLPNDYPPPPSITVASFGNSTATGAVAANGTNTYLTDNGATVTVGAGGGFNYNANALPGFAGYDKFGYTATTGNSPDNDAVVTIAVGAPPVANSDAYNVIGNVGIDPDASEGVLQNDLGTLPRAVVAVQGNPAWVGEPVSLANGTVTMASDGSFTYVPNAGFTGIETFTYSVDNAFATPATATVTLIVTGNIWFVNAAASTNGTGTLQSPFNNLQSFISINNNGVNNPGNGDALFLYENAAAYTGNLVLLPDQRVIGQDAGNNLVTLAGANPQTYTLALPSASLLGNGVFSTISSASGTTVTLATNNHLYGFNITGVTGLTGNSFGTLSGNDVAINTSGQALSLTTGTSAMSFSGMSSAGGTNGVALTGIAGTMFMNNPGTITGASSAAFLVDGGTLTLNCTSAINQSNNAAALHVKGGHNTGTLTFSGNINADNGTGLQFENADGTYNINGAANTIAANAVGEDAGIDILAGGDAVSGSTGTFNFSAGTALTRSVVTGAAFNLAGSDANVTFSGSISVSSGNLITIEDHDAGTMTFQTGSLTKSSSTNVGISVQHSGGGTISFNNPTITISSQSSNAVSLTGSNGGGTINFSPTSGGNGIDLNTTSGSGFNSTGGGTISLTGSGNTISSGSGTALNVVNTTIGASGLTFQSISANGGSKGIVLSSTGTSGGLTITGTGITDGSGGTIQNISARGIEALSTANLVLKNMTFTNANTVDASPCGASDNSGCNAAIHLSNVTGATLDNVDITGTVQNGINVRETSGFQVLNSTVTQTGAGGQTEEGGLYALNLFGTAAITNSSFSFPAVRGAVIYNTNKTLNMTVSGSSFNDTQPSPVGADGFEMTSFGSSNTTLSVTNCSFLRDKTNGVQFLTENTATGNISVTGSTVDPGVGVGVGFDFSSNGTSVLKYKILNNPSIIGRNASVVNLFAQGNSTMEGRVNGNVVNSVGTAGSAVRVVAQENTTKHTVEVLNNTISTQGDNGIAVQARTAGSPRIDATIQGNNITNGPNSAYNISVIAGASNDGSSSAVCAKIANNVVSPVPPLVPPAGNMVGNVQLRTGTVGAFLYLQGPGTSNPTYWDSNGNAPTTAAGATVSSPGLGTVQYNTQVCATPNN